eukprot:9976398-Heterocapsa_arctica.AAC.1
MGAILVLWILSKVGEQMVGHVKENSAKMVNDQDKLWDENMNKLTDWLQRGNEKGHHFHKKGIWIEQERQAPHILCKQCVMQEYQDKNRKYRNKSLVNHIDTDEEHRSTTAEIIDFEKGDPTMDTNTLAKYKGGKRHLDMPNKSNNGVDKGGH